MSEVGQYARFPTISILPPEYQRRYFTAMELVLVLAIMVAVQLPISSLQRFRDLRADAQALETQLRGLTTASTRLAPDVQRATELHVDIAQIDQTLERRRSLQGAVGGEDYDWDTLISTMLLGLPPGLELESVVRNGNKIRVQGRSQFGFPVLQLYLTTLVLSSPVSGVTITGTEARESEGGDSVLSFSLTVELASSLP